MRIRAVALLAGLARPGGHVLSRLMAGPAGFDFGDLVGVAALADRIGHLWGAVTAQTGEEGADGLAVVAVRAILRRCVHPLRQGMGVGGPLRREQCQSAQYDERTQHEENRERAAPADHPVRL